MSNLFNSAGGISALAGALQISLGTRSCPPAAGNLHTMDTHPLTTLTRRASAIALVLPLCAPVVAQDALVAKRDAKLAESWVAKSDWITDFDKAREIAKKSDKLIFTYFTRSYSP